MTSRQTNRAVDEVNEATGANGEPTLFYDQRHWCRTVELRGVGGLGLERWCESRREDSF